ncbi:uncharacterized protein N7487_001261 [Penicillium crustosum]|uniref:uncharacterized protein n=1 Tax=Penicillium crustosum TaxID=36656 RepID=UPI0023991F1D|nr:uncharacterized protein N7487_001261 [Penicillium crustosum]KAJ5417711.1 hypothetical protein N7487_001261 [Penicillium crustosum]
MAMDRSNFGMSGERGALTLSPEPYPFTKLARNANASDLADPWPLAIHQIKIENDAPDFLVAT